MTEFYISAFAFGVVFGAAVAVYVYERRLDSLRATIDRQREELNRRADDAALERAIQAHPAGGAFVDDEYLRQWKTEFLVDYRIGLEIVNGRTGVLIDPVDIEADR